MERWNEGREFGIDPDGPEKERKVKIECGIGCRNNEE